MIYEGDSMRRGENPDTILQALTDVAELTNNAAIAGDLFSLLGARTRRMMKRTSKSSTAADIFVYDMPQVWP
jgi:hypothetical protein